MSFTTQIKDELSALPIKSTCCRKAFLYGILYGATVTDKGAEVAVTLHIPSGGTLDFPTLLSPLFQKQLGCVPAISYETRGAHRYLHLSFTSKPAAFRLRDLARAETADASLLPSTLGFRCGECSMAFLRGVFLAVGTVTDPSKAYHMELRAPSDGRAELLCAHLLSLCFTPGSTRRRDSVGFFWKGSASIQDFLTYLGATHSVFAMLNTQIKRDIRNNENRATNCVAENISRSIHAGGRQVAAILFLQAHDLIPALSPELQITAKLRLEHPEATLVELAALHEPPITKSGLNHRLEKILALCERAGEKPEK